MDIQKLTYTLLAKRVATYFDSQKYVDWAVELLQNGYETESLVILAGLDSSDAAEKETYFWKAIRELKLNIEKSDFESVESYFRLVARHVIEDQINPTEGLNIILSVIHAGEYAPEYSLFYELEEDLDLLGNSESPFFNSELTLENREEYIKEEFRFFLETQGLEIDESLKYKGYCLQCNDFRRVDIRKRLLRNPVLICESCGSEGIEPSNHPNTKRRLVEIAKGKKEFKRTKL